MRRFEFIAGRSQKFWAIDLKGRSLSVTWGRLGTEGQSQVRPFPSREKAQAALESLVEEKLRKGYAEVRNEGRPGQKDAAAGALPVRLPWAEVRALLGPRGKRRTRDHPEDNERVLFYAHGVKADGDFKVPPGRVLIQGDVEVSGTLWHDEHTRLQILGRVRCKNFITSGPSSIQGDMDVSGIVYGNSTCDHSMDAGRVRARAVTNDGHEFICAVEGLKINVMTYGGDLADADFEPDELGQVFVPELVSAGGALDVKQLFRHLREDKPLFLENPRNTAARQAASLAAATGEGDVLELVSSAKRLKDVPAQVFKHPNLQHLDLSQNPISKLPRTLKNLSHLESINLSGCSFKTLPRELFELPALESLDVSSNPLSKLGPEVALARRLKVLRLDGTDVTALPVALARLPLEVLSFSEDSWSRRLKQVPGVVCSLASLKELALEGNPISALPEAFASLSRLEKVNLSCMALQEFPAVLEQLPALRALSLSGRRVHTGDPMMPARVALGALELESLEELRIDRFFQDKNRTEGLSHLPAGIRRLRKLRALDTSFNNLRSLPPALWQLPALKELALAHNPGIELPGELEQLETLDVASCDLRALPSLPSVRSLDLSGNVQIADWGPLGKMHALRTLAAQCVEWKKIPPALIKLEHLEALGLSFNPKLVLDDAIGQLGNLDRLDLSGCNLERLPASISRLHRLRTLRVAHNDGLRVKPAQLSELESLHELKLPGGALTKTELARLQKALPELQVEIV